jgi:hypothetical protein
MNTFVTFVIGPAIVGVLFLPLAIYFVNRVRGVRRDEPQLHENWREPK